MKGTMCVECNDIAWPSPRLEAENEKLLLDAGAVIVPVDIRAPLTEDAENTGVEGPSPMNMPPTACVGGTENDVFPTACMGRPPPWES